jgi:hypothetical protein
MPIPVLYHLEDRGGSILRVLMSWGELIQVWTCTLVYRPIRPTRGGLVMHQAPLCPKINLKINGI